LPASEMPGGCRVMLAGCESKQRPDNGLVFWSLKL
jgi:hypothetical protein